MSARQQLIYGLDRLLQLAVVKDESLQSEAELAHELQVLEHNYVSTVEIAIQQTQPMKEAA